MSDASTLEEGTEGQEQAFDALVDYQPTSKNPFQLELKIPRNLKFEHVLSMDRLVKEKGNLDVFVRDQLKYDSLEELFGALSAEQIDAVALYLQQFELGQSMIIGDQTGVGKGRQVGAALIHGLNQGYLPVFFTKDPDLFSDLYRDLKDLGFTNLKPFILNTTSNAVIKDRLSEEDDDEENLISIFHPLEPEEQEQQLVRTRTYPNDHPKAIEYFDSTETPLGARADIPEVTISDTVHELPAGYNCIFATYSQVTQASEYKRKFLHNLAVHGVDQSATHPMVIPILDESHLAGGIDSQINAWMRTQFLPYRKAALFASATFAKRPDSMVLYKQCTVVKEADMSDENYVESLRKGGGALLERVAEGYTLMGQYERRQRSLDNVKTRYLFIDQEPYLSKHKDIVERVTAIMRRIIDFEDQHITHVIEAVNAEAQKQAEKAEKVAKDLGVHHSPYFSRVHSITSQLLLALKVDFLVERVLESLANDEKPIILFESTLGGYLEGLHYQEGEFLDPKDLDFARTLTRGFETIFEYNYTDIHGEVTRRKIDLNEISPDARRDYQEIMTAIKTETTGLSISPLDQIRSKIEAAIKPPGLGGHQEAHYRVAEVTGRKRRIRFTEEGALLESFQADVKEAFKGFNNGGQDVLMLNVAGSTGYSAHASLKFKDQRVRRNFNVQLDKNIVVTVQKLGRSNRSGQRQPPYNDYICTMVAFEIREFNSSKSALMFLDAATTAAQDTNDGMLESRAFFNKIGDAVAYTWVTNNTNYARRLGWPTYKNSWGNQIRNPSDRNAMRQVTGRVAILPMEDQDKIYQELIALYDRQVNYEKQQGTYDLHTEYYDLEAEVKQRYLMYEGGGGDSPFGKSTYHDRAVVNNVQKPLRWHEMEEVMAFALEGKSPQAYQNYLYEQATETLNRLHEERVNGLQSEIEHAQQSLNKEEQSQPKNEEERAAKQYKLVAWQGAISHRERELREEHQHHEKISQRFEKGLKALLVGAVVKVPGLSNDETAYGIFTGFLINQVAVNPYEYYNLKMQFAVMDQRRFLSFNYENTQWESIEDILSKSTDLSEEEVVAVRTQWDNTVKQVAQKREKRSILTQNILAASMNIGGHNKLMKFTREDGSISTGILMHRGYANDQKVFKTLKKFSQALPLIKLLPIGASFKGVKKSLSVYKESEVVYRLAIHKGGNKNAYTDHELRNLMIRGSEDDPHGLPEFVQNGGNMVASFNATKLEAVLKVLDRFNFRFEGSTEEVELAQSNEIEWTTATQREWKYEYILEGPYSEGTQPPSGFVEYVEPAEHGKYPYGTLRYSRRLTDREKVNFGLVPIFPSFHIPYKEWKNYLKGEPDLNQQFQALLEEVKTLKDPNLEEVLYDLGMFMIRNSHESGNSQYVFGDYPPEKLGQAVYEDFIAVLDPISTLNHQLDILIGHLEGQFAKLQEETALKIAS